ncbi:uncharacterized protein [Miscanthus floridulus]|uniref:uncharacterized protein n=1 Tax=Miscanthus floridulus TaxID=154761 RepID=UPI00345AC610
MPTASAFLGDSSMIYAVDASENNKVDEDTEIKALILIHPPFTYSQIPDGSGSGRHYGRGIGGRMMAGRHFETTTAASQDSSIRHHRSSLRKKKLNCFICRVQQQDGSHKSSLPICCSTTSGHTIFLDHYKTGGSFCICVNTIVSIFLQPPFSIKESFWNL